MSQVIVKPSGEDASVGIDGGAVCTTRKALRDRLEHLGGQWDEILVQEYVPGREVNVGFVGSEMLPMAEIEFRDLPAGSWPILTYAAKWEVGSPEDLATPPVCPARLGRELRKRVAQVARAAWELLTGAMGYGRGDLRVPRMARARGWSYDQLILKVVEEALNRFEVRRAAEAQYLKISA